MIKNLLKKLRRNEFDHLIKKSAKEGKKKFLVPWNRGLGDIALGLYALVHSIRTNIPNAQIIFITREELRDTFLMLEGADVIVAPWWQRGVQIDMDNTLRRLGIKRTDFDVVLDKINPTKWLSWQIGKLTPKLKWKDEHDELWKRFDISTEGSYIAAHVNTETSQFYGYKKDWPETSWNTLFKRLSEQNGKKIILFGLNKKGVFTLPQVIDLRGQTTLPEMLSIIKNRCNILIAPDGGVLSIVYYLDVFFPITVISLWGDANQGVIKQAVASPNSGLKHIPLIGKAGDVSKIGVDEVFEKICFEKKTSNGTNR